MSHYRLKLCINGETDDSYEIMTTYNSSEKYSKNYTIVKYRSSAEDLPIEIFKYRM